MTQDWISGWLAVLTYTPAPLIASFATIRQFDLKRAHVFPILGISFAVVAAIVFVALTHEDWLDAARLRRHDQQQREAELLRMDKLRAIVAAPQTAYDNYLDAVDADDRGDLSFVDWLYLDAVDADDRGDLSFADWLEQQREAERRD